VRAKRTRHRRRIRKDRRLVPHFAKVLPKRNRKRVRRSRRIQKRCVRHVHPVTIVPEQHRAVSAGTSPAAGHNVELGTIEQNPDVPGMGVDGKARAHVVKVPPRDQIAGVSALGKAQ
jgi:hypothetical protein